MCRIFFETFYKGNFYETDFRVRIGFLCNCCESTNLPQILQPQQFKHHIDTFNANDEENVKQFYPNDKSVGFSFAKYVAVRLSRQGNRKNVLFSLVDVSKTYQENTRRTCCNMISSECSLSGKHSAISCPAGHHFREGRWRRDSGFLNDYAVLGLRKSRAIRTYSFWIADSILQHAAVTGNSDFLIN
jgi:hypothetical protein